MNEDLEESYFTWLYSQSGFIDSGESNRTHWELARILFKTEFTWFVPNDDNRVEDGRALRSEFLDGQTVSYEWMRLGCSVFEMLIALARRVAFEAGHMPEYWFELFMTNLHLWNFNDFLIRRMLRIDPDAIKNILDMLVLREYFPDGRGGLFPLDEPSQDQTKVEIWYQMSEWLLERL